MSQIEEGMQFQRDIEFIKRSVTSIELKLQNLDYVISKGFKLDEKVKLLLDCQPKSESA